MHRDCEIKVGITNFMILSPIIATAMNATVRVRLSFESSPQGATGGDAGVEDVKLSPTTH